MNEVILDASVLAKWFKTEGEQHRRAARRLRAEYERGELLITVPPLLFLELLNVAARRWRWDAGRLNRLAAALDRLGFEIRQPPLIRVAYWTGIGLTAYDACYVALAEERGLAVITDDDQMLALGGGFAHPLIAGEGGSA